MSLQDPRSHNQEGHPHSCSTPESLGTSDSTHNALWQSPTQEVMGSDVKQGQHVGCPHRAPHPPMALTSYT